MLVADCSPDPVEDGLEILGGRIGGGDRRQQEGKKKAEDDRRGLSVMEFALLHLSSRRVFLMIGACVRRLVRLSEPVNGKA